MGDYASFAANFINKINPETKMYYTVAEAAAAAGISEEQAWEYVTRAQTARGVEVGAIPDEPVAVEPGTAYTPGYIEGLRDAGVIVSMPTGPVSTTDTQPQLPTPTVGPVPSTPFGPIQTFPPPTPEAPAPPVLTSFPHVEPEFSIPSPAAPPGQATYYNAQGGLYNGEDVSYWQDPSGSGQWYMGIKATGEVVSIPAPPFATGAGEAGGANMIMLVALGIGALLLLRR